MSRLEPRQPIRVFFDGACGFCHGAVRFLLAHDRTARFRFAPLQGPTFRAAVPEERRRELPASLVVQTPDGRLLLRSAGLVYLLRRLAGAWPLVGGLLWLVPRPLRDLLYDLVARLRRRIFPPPPELCPRVPAEIGRRFDP